MNLMGKRKRLGIMFAVSALTIGFALGQMNAAYARDATSIEIGPVSSGNVAGSGISTNNSLNSIAIGGGSITTEEGATTTVTTANAASGAIAIGSGAVAEANLTDGFDPVALGIKSHASGTSATALGAYADATGNFATAVGGGAGAWAENAVAVGLQSNASGASSVAIGTLATTVHANSVALGSFSATGTAHVVTGMTIGGNTYNFAGVASDTKGTVSVGTAGNERQIQNVAAGAVSGTSTDAINGSQLQAVIDSTTVSTNATNTANGVLSTNTVGQNLDNLSSAIGDRNYGTNNVVANGDSLTTAIGKLDAAIGTTVDGEYVKNNQTIGQNLNALDTQVKANADNIANNRTDIDNIQQTLNTGYTFGADDASDSVAIGNTLEVKGDGKNISTTFTKDANTGNAVIKVSMSNTPEFDKVTIGTTAGSQVTIDEQGKITGAASGTIGSGSKDVVNGGDIFNYVGDTNNYSSTNVISNGDNVVTSVGKLDTAIGDQKYTGVSNKGPVTDGMSTTQAIGTINNSLGNVNNYGSNHYVTNGSSVTDSIGALDQGLYDTNQKLEQVGSDLNHVGALSAAMAGLHPRFQDGNKGELAMAIGTYGGKQALAAGGFYAPNEKVMFSLGMGVSMGGNKMANFGVNFALDRAKDRKKAPVDIVYTRREVDSIVSKLVSVVEKQQKEIEELKAKVK